MAVYYSFKHSTEKESIPIDDVFVTVRDLTQKILEAKKLTRGNNGLVMTNPLTNEDYVDEETLIRRCSTVVVRRVPRRHWRPLMPIVLGRQGERCESGVVQDMPKTRGVGGDGRIMGGRGFVQGTPPQGYVCHRCGIPGHFIQHCARNGDPNYDIKRVKPPTVEVSKRDEAAFGKEMESLSSASSFVDLPSELHCPLCKQVMRYAVFTSKCCFDSFCDKCIREQIVAKSMCVCGATGTLADYLVPNQTLRDIIIGMLESGNSNGNYGVSSSRTSSSTEDQKAASKKEKLSSSSEASTITSETDGSPRNGYSEYKATSTNTKKRAAATTTTSTRGFESYDDNRHVKTRGSSYYKMLSWEGQRDQQTWLGAC